MATKAEELKIMNRIQARMQENGQSSALPLFNASEPVEDTIEPNIVGHVIRDEYGLVFKFELGGINEGVRVITRMEPTESCVMNVANFVAQRDYTPKRAGATPYEKGKTMRQFAYRE